MLYRQISWFSAPEDFSSAAESRDELNVIIPEDDVTNQVVAASACPAPSNNAIQAAQTPISSFFI